jgi:hypothetical protein
MSAFNMSMFESIKGALAASEGKSQNKYTEIINCKPGNTYTVRLLPYSKSPKDTFFHYYNHGWVSFATGQYVQALSPQTFGERDPIAEERFRASRMGSEEEKDKAQSIRRVEKWLVNCYVIDDPTNPDNNGKIKILRYGKQLQKIISEAIEGEDSEEFGPRIFDLGPNGVNLKVKVEQQGEYPTYVSSRFTSAGKIDLSEEEQKNIYENVFNLTEVFPVRSYDELKEMLDEHYFCKSNEPTPAQPVSTPVSVSDEPVYTATPASSMSVDDDIDELLKDL